MTRCPLEPPANPTRAHPVDALPAQVNYYRLSHIEQFLFPFSWLLWSLAEVGRLYFGFSGNLQEKVPQIVAFEIACVVPQVSVQPPTSQQPSS